MSNITVPAPGSKVRLHITPRMVRDGKCRKKNLCAVEEAAASKFRGSKVVAGFSTIHIYAPEEEGGKRLFSLHAVQADRHMTFTGLVDWNDPKTPTRTSFTYEVHVAPTPRWGW